MPEGAVDFVLHGARRGQEAPRRTGSLPSLTRSLPSRRRHQCHRPLARHLLCPVRQEIRTSLSSMSVYQHMDAGFLHLHMCSKLLRAPKQLLGMMCKELRATVFHAQTPCRQENTAGPCATLRTLARTARRGSITSSGNLRCCGTPSIDPVGKSKSSGGNASMCHEFSMTKLHPRPELPLPIVTCAVDGYKHLHANRLYVDEPRVCEPGHAAVQKQMHRTSSEMLQACASKSRRSSRSRCSATCSSKMTRESLLVSNTAGWLRGTCHRGSFATAASTRDRPRGHEVLHAKVVWQAWNSRASTARRPLYCTKKSKKKTVELHGRVIRDNDVALHAQANIDVD